MTSSPSPPSSEEKHTILFADVCGSTQIYEQHGDAEGLRIVGGAVSVLSEVTTTHDGTVVKTIGDEVMARFADPSVACKTAEAMHRAIREEESLSELDVRVKIGLHCGEVLMEAGDVYGDAVNVAARMVELAQADQIITTQATIEQLPEALRENTRRLSKITVRGKEQPLQICEYLWKSDDAARTVVGGPSYQAMLQQASSKLLLEYRNQEISVDADDAVFTLGRSKENSLAVEHGRVSRRHAHIEFVNGFFVLTDRSTNGTHVRMGAEEVVIHRDEIRLMGEGYISLGQPLREDESQRIRFACQYQR